MKTKLVIILIVILLLSVTLSGCLPSESKQGVKRANFLTGIWHGWIAPVSLIVGIFDKDVSIYQPFNTGWWYDFGFYIAIISGFGGLSLVRRKKSHND